VDVWVFWREVWAWGGPGEVHKNKVRGGGLPARVKAAEKPSYAFFFIGRMQTMQHSEHM
jgi:hypothetical protein